MLARLAPYNEPHAGRGGGAERHRRAGLGLHIDAGTGGSTVSLKPVHINGPARVIGVVGCHRGRGIWRRP
jgi:hypothetical protein